MSESIIELLRMAAVELRVRPSENAGIVEITIADRQKTKTWHFTNAVIKSPETFQSFLTQIIKDFKRGKTE